MQSCRQGPLIAGAVVLIVCCCRRRAQSYKKLQISDDFLASEGFMLDDINL